MCPEIENIIARTEADPPIAIDMFFISSNSEKILKAKMKKRAPTTPPNRYVDKNFYPLK